VRNEADLWGSDRYHDDKLGNPATQRRFAVYSAGELSYQLTNSRAKAIFTVFPLLPIVLSSATKANIPNTKIFILPMPGYEQIPHGCKSLTQLIDEGKRLSELEATRWNKGQAERQAAFLCYSSGTSGLPKGVIISHQNVIARISFQIRNLFGIA
jgi:ribosome assembly protein SQT1